MYCPGGQGLPGPGRGKNLVPPGPAPAGVARVGGQADGQAKDGVRGRPMDGATGWARDGTA